MFQFVAVFSASLLQSSVSHDPFRNHFSVLDLMVDIFVGKTILGCLMN